jgi:opacity protein-like surface antigen
MKYTVHMVVAVLFAAATAVSHAQQGSRAGKWEFTLQPQYTQGTDVGGANGSTAKIDSDYGFGLGFAFNLNERFSLGGEFTWSQADYTANVVGAPPTPGLPRTISGEMYTSTLRLNGTWHLLPGPLTPFLTGGLGYTYVDTNIPEGPPSSSCWWDPWTGLTYCGTYYPTRTDSYFSYMGGLGVRWDAPQNFFLRGVVLQQYLDVGGAVGTLDTTQYRIDLGFLF